MEKYHITWTCLPEAHLRVFQLCVWPLIAPGYLEEGCHASRQPSDASTPLFCSFCSLYSVLLLLLLFAKNEAHVLQKCYHKNTTDRDTKTRLFSGTIRYQDVSILDFWSKRWWKWWVVTSRAIRRAMLQSYCHRQVPTCLQHAAFYRPDAFPVTQQTVSKHWREILRAYLG